MPENQRGAWLITVSAPEYGTFSKLVNIRDAQKAATAVADEFRLTDGIPDDVAITVEDLQPATPR